MTQEEKSALSNLLAVMHGDGGHYEDEHGTLKSIEDAQKLIHTKWVTNDHLTEINNAHDLIKELAFLVKKRHDFIAYATRPEENERIEELLKRAGF